MEKHRYYVSVQAGTVLPNQGDAAYEFEIDATEKEVEELMKLFEQREAFLFDTFFRAHIPAVPYHYDLENDVHDQTLHDIYRMIHQLGTEETKNHIHSMGLV
ncbi:hypothetical protein [Brevibacillus sp. H7]|jgi:chloramphenicol 3-O-phosphotransferase|uniref:hypothetical protein n=1 Tax=Brevibacillus sp. H7 TaxID=3349138 RepID=UPI0037FCB3B8